MSSFKRRLSYYALGFGIGLLFVFFFFNNRGCSWLPENRIKSLISQQIVFVSDKNKEVLTKLRIGTDELKAYIESAEIHFSKSVKNVNPRIYHLEGSTKNQENFVSQIVLYNDAFVCELIPNVFTSKKAKPEKKGFGYPIVYPDRKNFFYSDTSAHTICERKALGIADDSTLMSKFISFGRIDLENSRLTLQPKPEHKLIIMDDENPPFGFKASFYKEKARIFSFEYDGEDCN
jgi:hypothetical protein